MNITNNQFTKNDVLVDGGGIYLGNVQFVEIHKNIFIENYSQGG